MLRAFCLPPTSVCTIYRAFDLTAAGRQINPWRTKPLTHRGSLWGFYRGVVGAGAWPGRYVVTPQAMVQAQRKHGSVAVARDLCAALKRWRRIPRNVDGSPRSPVARRLIATDSTLPGRRSAPATRQTRPFPLSGLSTVRVALFVSLLAEKCVMARACYVGNGVNPDETDGSSADCQHPHPALHASHIRARHVRHQSLK